jgi:hypothetical protein
MKVERTAVSMKFLHHEEESIVALSFQLVVSVSLFLFGSHAEMTL